ncbi:MAG: hypothetical protein GPJ14_18870 [Microcystis aeruginosa G11-01]|nr:hypothetical protein [Microcystis aeruginosa G11-01]
MKWNQVSLADENFIEQYIEGCFKERDHILKPDKLTPYQAYRTLKDHFGSPNSQRFDGMKSQWEYSLQTDEAYFEIYDWKLFGLSIGIYLKPSSTRNAEDVANDFLSALEQQASKLNSVFKEKIKNADVVVIENPFFTYRETADSIHEMLVKAKSPKPSTEGQLFDGFDDYIKHYDLCRAAFILYLSSVEGFVNLIYELYLRRELREKRIYERISREQIDLKLRLAPVYCLCFKENILDPETKAFKDFHSLVNLRNDFVHANFTKPMMNPIICEDGFEFGINTDSATSIGIPNNFSDLQSAHVDTAKNITQELIDYVVAAMSLRYRKKFKSIMYWDYIKVESKDGQLSIL